MAGRDPTTGRIAGGGGAKVKFRWNPRFWLDRFDMRVQSALDRTAIAATADIKASYTSPGVSSPGQPPGIVTGTLKRSITFEREASKPLTRKVGSILKPSEHPHTYGWYLEYGTKRIKARPHLRPQLPVMRKRLKRELKR